MQLPPAAGGVGGGPWPGRSGWPRHLLRVPGLLSLRICILCLRWCFGSLCSGLTPRFSRYVRQVLSSIDVLIMPLFRYDEIGGDLNQGDAKEVRQNHVPLDPLSRPPVMPGTHRLRALPRCRVSRALTLPTTTPTPRRSSAFPTPTSALLLCSWVVKFVLF